MDVKECAYRKTSTENGRWTDRDTDDTMQCGTRAGVPSKHSIHKNIGFNGLTKTKQKKTQKREEPKQTY